LSLSNTSFEEISEPDLQTLIDTGVSEGHLIEYKSAPYGRNDEQVKEFLKDASSFANTYGGHLLIGMEESEGVASRIAPICGADVDAEIARLENLLRDGLEPRVLGIRIRAVPVSPTGSVFVLRIPRSWNPPHRISARNWNRVFARNSAGAHEMSMEELRASFTMAASAYDRARAFRSERLALIDAGDTPVPVSPRPDRLVLHLVPLSAFGGTISEVDLGRARQLSMQLYPIGAPGSSSFRTNYEGFITFRVGDVCNGYTQLFRNGLIEAVFVNLVNETQRYGRLIPGQSIEQYIIARLPAYLGLLATLDVPTPILIMLTLQNVKGAVYAIGDGQVMYGNRETISKAALVLPEAVIENYGAAVDYERALKPALDVLWNSAGYPDDGFFDENGHWTGTIRAGWS